MVSLTTSWPKTSAAPESGGRRVTRMRIVVVLPAPLGPSRPKISPEVMSKLTPPTATTSLNFREMSRTRTAGWATSLIQVGRLQLARKLHQQGQAFDHRLALNGRQVPSRAGHGAARKDLVAAQHPLALGSQVHDHLAAVAGVRGAGNYAALLQPSQLAGESRPGDC